MMTAYDLVRDFIWRGGLTMSDRSMATAAWSRVPGMKLKNLDELEAAIAAARKAYPGNLFAVCQDILEMSDEF